MSVALIECDTFFILKIEYCVVFTFLEKLEQKKVITEIKYNGK